MATFSALLALCAGIHWLPVNSPHKGQWRGALMLSLICAWISGWVNHREAGDLRRHRAHYDVIVMRWLTVVWQTIMLTVDPYDDLFRKTERIGGEMKWYHAARCQGYWSRPKIQIYNRAGFFRLLGDILKYISVTSQWARWCPKSPALWSWLSTQPFAQARMK